MLFYSFLLCFAQPVVLSCVLIGLSWYFGRKWHRLSGSLLAGSVLLLMVCGNGWVVSLLARSLEWRHRPVGDMPSAQAIILLSGGILAQEPPRLSIELDDASDRVFYAAFLYHQGKAPLVLCTGGFVPGTTRQTSYFEDTKEVLRMLGVPSDAILGDNVSRNTYEQVKYLAPLLKHNNLRRVLLVTSALHMPRSLAVFQKRFPDMEIIPAATDFTMVSPGKQPPLIKRFAIVLPSAQNLALLDRIVHEYLGMAYYKCRGWM
jgi:uncharacterized SAM-binding protein YcdF (DUF218 family)